MLQSRASRVVIAALVMLCAVQSARSLVIRDAKRTINASKQRVFVHTTFQLANDEKSPVDTVTFCLLSRMHVHAAVLEVLERSASNKDEDGENSLAPRGSWTPRPGAPADVVCGDYALSTPIPSGKTRDIKLAAIFTHVLRPRPAEMRQGETQRMLLTDSAHIIAPYNILRESTDVKLGDDKPSLYNVPDPAEMKGAVLAMGPYSNVAPFAAANMTVHYKNGDNFLEARSIERNIRVSHLTGVHVAEEYDISHGGAKLAGSWSRIEAMVNPQAATGLIQQITTAIPGSAHSLYFKDRIGNISSSDIISRPNEMFVYLTPRYPLAGGWSTKFKFGYTVPLAAGVAIEQPTGRYVLSLSALPSITDYVIDELVVRAVLPEGATDPKFDAAMPFEASQWREKSYLDVLGRPVVELKFRNVVPESNGALYVSYSYSSVAMLQRPLLGAAAAVAVAIVAALVSGLSSLAADPVAPSRNTKLHAS